MMNNFYKTFAISLAFLFYSSLLFPQSSLSIKNYITIRGGSFTMGSNNKREYAAAPEHIVTLTDYMLCKYEVTVGDFKTFVDETGYLTDAEKGEYAWAFFNGKWDRRNTLSWRLSPNTKVLVEKDFNYPVVFVTYNDAVSFCKWLSKKLGHKCRLPTEAEWEYAASNKGQHKVYCWGDTFPPKKPVANIADISTKYRYADKYWFYLEDYNDGYDFLAPVGSYPPNELGLFDLCGNVYELCSDYFCMEYYSNSEKINPQGPTKGKPYPPKNVIGKVARGGCYYIVPSSNTIKHRMYFGLNEPCHTAGFRVAITIN